jgi:hypothetical protein
MNALARSLMGMALAAGAVYLFDPVSGHRRRLILRDECVRAAHKLDDGTRRTRHNLSHRAQDVASVFKADRPSDRKLTARIRDVLGQTVAQPRSIDVAVHDGHVVLRGELFTHELDHLVDAVRSVHGVRVVTDQLTARERNGGAYRGAGSGSGWPLTSGIFLGATACGLLVWGVKERKALSSWGQNVWRTSKREIDEALARAKGAVETAVESHEVPGTESYHSAADAAGGGDAQARRQQSDLAREARSHIA